jgi:SAM-dependent methyltransferase
MLRSALAYWMRRKTPVRELCDAAVKRLAPELTGRVLELGAINPGRREFATNATEYLTTNLVGPVDLILDATKMDLPDQSVDGFLCESVIEHLPDPDSLISEVRRVLRVGGRFLLIAPWMYPFHGAPGDYYRFSEPALRAMLNGFHVVHSEPLGNFWTTASTSLQLKVSPWRPMAKWERAARIAAGAPLLALGLALREVGKVDRRVDDFVPMFCVLAVRKR